MPIINSDFKASFPFTNKHFSTVFRTLFTKPVVAYTRKRIETPDNDFLDLDFIQNNADKLVLAIHGLEGDANSKYIAATNSFLASKGFDICTINLRGCSGTLNKHYRAYHTGETGDLDFVLKYILKNYNYTTISLLGFSLGGNVVLKYAGEQKENLLSTVSKVVAISPPCELKGSSKVLAKKSNYIYMKRFLISLIAKAKIKAASFPQENLDIEKLEKSKNFADFDSIFTAPSFGFKSAEDYWEKASSLPYLKAIKVPTYILTAADDPFLSEGCIPSAIAKKHDRLQLEITPKGGHIGFVPSFRKKDRFWMENRICNFLST